MKILCCQIDIEGVTARSAMEDHQARISNLIRTSCSNESVDLVLLPELSAIEYSTPAFDNLAELATDFDDWLVDSMVELAREINTPICFGMPRRDNKNLHISQVYINSDGVVDGYYDKVHVAQLGASPEKHYFTPGDHVTVIELAGYRIGIIICYDMRFGDYISTMVREHKLDIMLHPVAFYQDGTFASWRSFVCTRALENQIYWLSLNRAGEGWGHSKICPPWFEHENEVIELNDSEALKVVEIDRELLQYAEDNYPLKRDRLHDYSSIIYTQSDSDTPNN